MSFGRDGTTSTCGPLITRLPSLPSLRAEATPGATYELVSNGRFIDPATGASSRYQTKVVFASSVGFYVWQEFFERNVQDTADATKATYVLRAYQRQ